MTMNDMLPLGYELLARASSTSEVLTLNLTNLLILIVLKALIFGFGLFSVGSGTGRSSDEATTVSEGELTGGMCFLLYTSGDHEKLSCIQKTACEDPKKAFDYHTAGKMWFKMANMLNIDVADKYATALKAIEGATEQAYSNGDCSIYNW